MSDPVKPTQPVAPATKPVEPAEPEQLPADKDRVFFDKLTEALKSDTSSDGGKARLVANVKALVKEHEAKEK